MSHNLSKVAAAMKRRHDAFVPQLEPHEKLPNLAVKPYWDLRWDKLGQVAPHSDYTMFLNARGSMSHIVHRDDVDDPDFDILPHLRFPIPKRLWGAHPEYVRRWVLDKLIRRHMI